MGFSCGLLTQFWSILNDLLHELQEWNRLAELIDLADSVGQQQAHVNVGSVRSESIERRTNYIQIIFWERARRGERVAVRGAVKTERSAIELTELLSQNII